MYWTFSLLSLNPQLSHKLNGNLYLIFCSVDVLTMYKTVYKMRLVKSELIQYTGHPLEVSNMPLDIVWHDHVKTDVRLVLEENK